MSTLGVNIVKKSIPILNQGAIINLMLWDIATKPHFYMDFRPYFNGADAVVLFFDINRSNSFTNMNNWWQICDKHGLIRVPIFLVGIISDPKSPKI